MDTFKNGAVFHYGVWNFFRYLTEAFPTKTGAMPDLLLKMWQYADSSKGPRKDKFSTQAIDKALKKAGHVRLGEMFANYSAATRVTHTLFNEGTVENYPVKPLAGTATLGPKKKKTFKAKLDHLTSSTFQFVPSGTTKLKLRFKMAPKSKGSRAVVTTYGTNGSLTFKTVKVNARGVANKKFEFNSATVIAVEVTLVNTSTKYRDCFRRSTPYACSGRPVDDNQRARVQGKAV
jgi:hypothetical protein